MSFSDYKILTSIYKNFFYKNKSKLHQKSSRNHLSSYFLISILISIVTTQIIKILYKNIITHLMKNLKKYLKFQNIQLSTIKEHPRDISRAHLKIIDHNDNNAQYKTFKYGHVQPQKVYWQSPVELIFTGQESLHFQTVCEHEYGYEIQELKALYNGVIYLKPDQFFFDNTTHVLNQQGQHCGTLKFMVKIVERQFIIDNGEQKIDKKQAPPKEPVKVNLIAKISIYGANLMVNPYFINVFHKKKRRNLALDVNYGTMNFKGQPKFGQLEYKWLINSKFQVYDNSPEIIYFQVTDDSHPYLEGSLTLANLQANKRFTVQIVQLTDQNDQNIASLHIDLRYISKKELLDLMYSPKQLSQNKMQRSQNEKHFQQSRVASVADGIKLEKEKKLYDLLHKHSVSKQIQSSREHYSPIHRYRYKSRVASDHQDTTIPRSKRFKQIKAINERVSYLEPSLLSDFTPQNKKKIGFQSIGSRNDVTKHLKDYPGVGEYHLPSIFEKK